MNAPAVMSGAPRSPRRLLLLLAGVLLAASLLDHALMRQLGARVMSVHRQVRGAERNGPPILALGSSIPFYGLSFDQIGAALNRPVQIRSVGSGSACELEGLAAEVPEATFTIVGISAYDWNEAYLADARAELVPLSRTIRDLWTSRATWRHAKRVRSQYPLAWARACFPTAGRSTLVLTGLRARLRPGSTGIATEAAPRLEAQDAAGPEESIAEWSAGRLLRRLTGAEAASLGQFEFDGVKRRATTRLLQNCSRRGKVTLIVFPVAAPLARRSFTAAVQQRFESALAALQQDVPGLEVLRLDQHPTPFADTEFWDLVHLNRRGKERATALVLEHLRGKAAP